jgi:hypothetical protein
MTSCVTKFANVKADTPCFNCGADFADHVYVTNSIDRYTCPHPATESGYGAFNGGDPRKFFPDPDCSSEKEIAAWKAACEEAERLESARSLSCPSGFERQPDGRVFHILRAPFCIGTYVIECDQEFEARDEDDPRQMLLEEFL